MTDADVLTNIVLAVITTIIGAWFGWAVALAACVNHADKGVTHPFFQDYVVCKVKYD